MIQPVGAGCLVSLALPDRCWFSVYDLAAVGLFLVRETGVLALARGLVVLVVLVVWPWVLVVDAVLAVWPWALGVAAALEAGCCFDGASSQGRICWASSRRRAVTSLAESDCERGMPYLAR